MKVLVESVTEAELRAVDCQLRCRDLCRKLTELLFAEDELATGNATEARTTGVKLLDAHKLYAIRGMPWLSILYFAIPYPCSSLLVPVPL